MRRKLNRSLPSWDLGKLPLIFVAGALVTVSALFSVTFAAKIGAPSGNAPAFILMALAIEGYAAFSLPVLWPRLPGLGRVLLLAFLLPCLIYKVTAAHRFAVENIGTREAARERQVVRYAEAEARVKDLRAQLDRYAGARPAAMIHADIEGAKQNVRWDSTKGCVDATVIESRAFCAGYHKLRAELAEAAAFTRVETELAAALTHLQTMAPVAGVSAETSGPVAWIYALLGVPAGSFVQFVSDLVMLVVEGGAVAVPALVGFAKRPVAAEEIAPRKAPPPAEPPEVEETPPKISAKGLTDKAKEDAAELVAFLGDRTDRGAGEKVQSTTLYLIYSDWMQGAKRDPMTINQFGTLMTHHLGIAKQKRGGKNWYLNIRLKAPAAAAASARHLRAVG